MKNVGKGKKIALVSLVLVTILIVAGVIAYCLIPMKKGPDGAGSNMGFAEQMGQTDLVSAYGVTSIGTIQVEFPITNLESNLIVENEI